MEDTVVKSLEASFLISNRLIDRRAKIQDEGAERESADDRRCFPRHLLFESTL